MVVWAAFVIFCAVGMAYPQLPYIKVGPVTYFEILLVPAGLLGVGPLIRIAGARERSGARTMCRILIAYLGFELLVVIPVAMASGTVKPTVILSEIAVRFTWLLFPMMLALCADDRARHRAGTVAVVAAAGLIVWGVYAAATGGGGYYLELGELRYRVLYGGSLMLFAWPFVLAFSRDVRRRSTIPLIGILLAGLVLTNMRSGYIACAIGGLICLVSSKQLRRVVPWMVPAVLVGVIVALLWGQQAGDALGYTMSHLLDLSSGTGADRTARDVLAWNFFARYPFNDFVWSWRIYLVYLQNPYGPHNFVASIAVTEGVAGLIFYASMLVLTFRDSLHWIWKDAETRALFAYLTLYVVFQFANAGWYAPVNLILFIAAAAALVTRVDRLRQGEASSDPLTIAEQGSQDSSGHLLLQESGPEDGDLT